MWDDDAMAESPEQTHVSFQQAFNRHDLDALAAMYEPDAVMAGAGGPAQGVDAIRELLRGFLALRPTIEMKTLGVNRAGNLALLHSKWTIQGTGPDGSEVHLEGRSAETVRLQPDGRWLIVIDNPSVPWD